MCALSGPYALGVGAACQFHPEDGGTLMASIFCLGFTSVFRLNPKPQMFPNGVRVTPTEPCYKKNEYFF